MFISDLSCPQHKEEGGAKRGEIQGILRERLSRGCLQIGIWVAGDLIGRPYKTVRLRVAALSRGRLTESPLHDLTIAGGKL